MAHCWATEEDPFRSEPARGGICRVVSELRAEGRGANGGGERLRHQDQGTVPASCERGAEARLQEAGRHVLSVEPRTEPAVGLPTRCLNTRSSYVR